MFSGTSWSVTLVTALHSRFQNINTNRNLRNYLLHWNIISQSSFLLPNHNLISTDLQKRQNNCDHKIILYFVFTCVMKTVACICWDCKCRDNVGISVFIMVHKMTFTKWTKSIKWPLKIQWWLLFSGTLIPYILLWL